MNKESKRLANLAALENRAIRVPLEQFAWYFGVSVPKQNGVVVYVFLLHNTFFVLIILKKKTTTTGLSRKSPSSSMPSQLFE